LQIEDFGLLITFSSYLVFQGALFWDRRRPRLQTSPLRSLS